MRAFLVFLGMPRSKNLIWILALAALGYFFGQQPYVVRGGNLRNQVLSYDVAGYYAYLPMLFVERDLRLEKTWKYDMIQLVGVHEHPVSGGRHLKFTAGMAYLYAPFFAAAHAYTLATNPEEAHGFSLPYRFGIGLAGVVYPLVGLVFLRRFLRHYVPDAAISWTLFALFLGTNLFYYSSFRGAMSHGATFMLGAAMLYQADLWRRREQVWRLGVLGVLAGLIVLIRPVNVLIPLAVAAMFTMDGRLPKGLLTPKIRRRALFLVAARLDSGLVQLAQGVAALHAHGRLHPFGVLGIGAQKTRVGLDCRPVPHRDRLRHVQLVGLVVRRELWVAPHD